MIPTRTPLILCLSLALFMLSSAAQAYINNPNYRNNSWDYGNWANVGDIRIVGVRRCVMSTDGPNRRTFNPTNYTVTASMTTGDGVFQLTQVGGDGSGQETIPFSLEYDWFDDTSSTNESLGYGVPSNQHLGGIRVNPVSCSINGVRVNNGRMIIQINEADLQAAENGDYEGYLTVTHTGGIAMGQTRTRNNVLISLTVASDMIQIRRVDTVDLGTWDTVSAFMDDNEAYCVYTATGNYRITASSATEGSGGAGTFAIEHTVLAGVKIDFDLFVDDDNNALGGTPIANGGTVTGFTGWAWNFLCFFIDNAAIYARTASNLSQAQAGVYTSQVTLRVSPE